MKQTTTGTIAVTSYNPAPYSQLADGPDLVEINIVESFDGGIIGEGAARFVQTLRKDGSATFCGAERVTGKLAGRRGTFVLQDTGTLANNTVAGSWFVVPGSGTGELAGLRGEGTFEAQLGEHAHWNLTYWFE
jgi:hypothetical protein